MGAHFEAITEGVLVVSSKIIEKFFCISSFPTGLCFTKKPSILLDFPLSQFGINENTMGDGVSPYIAFSDPKHLDRHSSKIFGRAHVCKITICNFPLCGHSISQSLLPMKNWFCLIEMGPHCYRVLQEKKDSDR